MTRIIHLSDLHFGRARPELLAPLSTAIQEAAPDLVVVSGDLSQRARNHEFREARGFLDALGARWMAVPGNHDIPLFQPVSRILRPYRTYREWIAWDLEPVAELDDALVVGVNTVDRFAHQRGKARFGAMRHVCETVEQAGRNKLCIVVAHHPFEQTASVEKKPMKRAGLALDKLKGCGAHLVLSGHLHMWHAGPFVTRPGVSGPVQVHAGTSLSTRLRGEVNDFAVLDVEGQNLCITRMAVESDGIDFREMEQTHFRREGRGLLRVEA
ncbi:MAG TPA: phosphodiesterase [Maritimibacter sp.]|nr:phosphodiesterase [Maritimibacter sp.]